MAERVMGSNLEEYLEASGWSCSDRRPFSTMGCLRHKWEKDGVVIQWGFDEAGFPPTLSYPVPCVRHFDGTNTHVWRSDPATTMRWLAATPAEEVVGCLLDPKWTMPHEYLSERFRQLWNV